MASLHAEIPVLGDTVICGGALVDEEFILTARHCTSPVRLKVLFETVSETPEISYAGLGTRHKDPASATESSAQRVELAQGSGGLEVFYPNESSDPAELVDLALIKLAAPVSEIEPIALSSASTPGVDTRGVLLGWGVTSALHNNPELLEIHRAAVAPASTCTASEKANGYTGANLFCAGNPDDDYAATGCLFDSGGPFFVGKDGSGYLAGVLSSNNPDDPFAGTCFESGQPDTFNDISQHTRWITETIASAR